MSALRVVALCGVVALVMVTLGAAVASADTVTVYPEGETSATGRVRFTSSLGSTECPITLSGSLEPVVEGTLTEAPEPGTNPELGPLTSGSIGSCSTGSATISVREASVYAVEVAAGESTLYMTNVRVLIAAFGVVRCEIDMGLELSHDSTTGESEIVGVDVLGTSALGAACPREIGATGTFTFDPSTMVFNAALARIDCKEETFNNDIVSFEQVSPGGGSTRFLHCRNISGAGTFIRVTAGTTFTGEAEYMRIIEQPAVGSVFFNNETGTIRLRFEAARDAPRRTYVASFRWSLDIGWDTTMCVGRVV